MSTNVLAEQKVVTGIDIGRNGKVSCSTGYQITVDSYAQLCKLFQQFVDYKTAIIGLEDHSKASREFKLKNKKLFQAHNLIVRYSKNRSFGNIELVSVDKFKSSIICSRCRFVDKESRVLPWQFECTACGYKINADVNAAINIKYAAQEIIENII